MCHFFDKPHLTALLAHYGVVFCCIWQLDVKAARQLQLRQGSATCGVAMWMHMGCDWPRNESDCLTNGNGRMVGNLNPNHQCDYVRNQHRSGVDFGSC